MRVERTEDRANLPPAGFEDREDHRTPFASAMQPVRGVSSTCPRTANKSGASITSEPVLLVNSNPSQLD